MIYYHEIRKMILDYIKQEGLRVGVSHLLQIISTIITDKEDLIKEEEKKDAPL